MTRPNDYTVPYIFVGVTRTPKGDTNILYQSPLDAAITRIIRVFMDEWFAVPPDVLPEFKKRLLQALETYWMGVSTTT